MEFTQGGNPIQWVSRTRLDLKTGIGFDIKDRERCTSAEKVLGLTSNQYNVSVASWTMTTELVLLTITPVVQGVFTGTSGFYRSNYFAILARTLNKANNIFHSGGRQVYHRRFKAAVSQCYEQIKEEK
uniref:Uncharacterized protein n=1 Tax=Solanum lycopersicum TaxID=4081 RepID=A0A3Q7JHI0_SOLLC